MREIVELLDAAERPIRFPRSFLPHAAAERLLISLGVEIVDDPTLEEQARAWLTICRDPDSAAAAAVRDRLAA